MRFKNLICFLGIMIIQISGDAMIAQNKVNMEEYELKAAFLIRFLDYISWENQSKNKEIEIAILEQSPISKSLIDLAKDKKVKVTVYKNLNDVSFCNILFVPNNCTVPIKEIISKFSDKPVLVVTEHNGYSKKGAHMNFIIVDDKLKFEVNLKAINNSGIGVSSFLLQHAIIVQ